VEHRAGEALAQCNVEDREVFRRAAGDRVDDLAPFGRAVRFLAEGNERGGGGRVAETHQRRRDAVEGRARHQTDGEGPSLLGHAFRIEGGSPAALRTEPPAAMSLARASSAPIPARTITTATFTLPPAASMAARARARSGAPHSITMRSPRSTNFSLQAIRSTIRFP